MIYLRLFLVFLEIGAVSFGGGYGMIALIRELTIANGWLTEEELMNFIAVSESTPGPIAVNMATFVGSSQGGILGALVATVGVVLPAFVIMLLIATVIRNLIKYRGVQAFLSGVRPAVIGLIVATAAVMGCKVLLSVSAFGDLPVFDWKVLLIFALLLAVHFGWKKVKKKKPSPIVMILISACLGILLGGI